MKSHRLLAGLIALLPLVAAGSVAAENYRIETRLYVYRTAAFHPVTVSGQELASLENRAIVIHPPATLGFGPDTLTLAGANLDWRNGGGPPAGFSLIAAPAIILPPGMPAEILSTAPMQYLEKQADGALQVRNIPADSPDAPHCRLTFTLDGTASGTDPLSLTCDLDIATVASRETIPGVTLSVGKPVLARFNETLSPSMHPGEWSALFLRAPNGSDYSMLVLLKIAAAPPASPLLERVGEYHLREPRYGAAAVAAGDSVYVIGGRNRGGLLGDIERFDTRTHEITTLPVKLIPRHHQGAVRVGGKIYIFGGIGYGLPGSSGLEETLEIYDLASGRLTEGAPMPWPHANFAAAALDGKIYAIGGVMGSQRADVRETPRTDVYDIARNAWLDGVPMPTSRQTRTAAVAGEAIIVAGGYSVPNISSGLKIVERFAPTTQQWDRLPNLAEPVGANSAAVLGDRLYLFGNYDPADEIVAYDLTTHQSTVIKHQLISASQSAAVALKGKIYVIGGLDRGGHRPDDRDPLDLIQVFAPAAAGSGALRTDRPMTAAELMDFTAYYYRHPQPDLVRAAIEGLGSGTLLRDNFWTFVGFFAEVFARNPDRTAEWRKLGSWKNWDVRDCLLRAQDLSRAGAILALHGPMYDPPAGVFGARHSGGSVNSIWWGAFYASGDAAYIRKLAGKLRDVSYVPGVRDAPFTMGTQAMYLLAVGAQSHPVIRETLESMRANADPRTRKLIDDLLAQDLTTIRREIAAMAPTPTGLTPDYDTQTYRPQPPPQPMVH